MLSPQTLFQLLYIRVRPTKDDAEREAAGYNLFWNSAKLKRPLCFIQRQIDAGSAINNIL